ncbi:HAD hydrolase-like protein [Candidatus Woesearchaeota archaeon]|nr:HAD hydrolase-like protein [Candidatus Woesearchaeota archaeon]
MQEREVKAILFDMDGVLVDSEDAWFHAFKEILSKYSKKYLSKKEFSKKQKILKSVSYQMQQGPL